MLELTIKELVDLHPNLITDRTRESIIKNNYKMRTSVKKALITQLECSYNKVEYVAGRRGVPTKLILDNLKEEPDEYLGSTLGGRPELDLSEEFRLLNNWVSQVRPLYDKKNIRTNRRYTASKIIKEAYSLKEISEVVKILLLDSINDFKAFQYFEHRGYNQNEYERKQLEEHSRELSGIYKESLRRLQKQIVDRWLENSIVNYNEVYMAKNGNNFFEISKEKYLEYKEYDAYFREISANLNMNRKNQNNSLQKNILRKFKFEFAYIAYEFYDNENLQNDNIGEQLCKGNLYNRLIKSAEKSDETSKPYPEGWNIEYDNMSIRLKRLKEFKEVSEIIWSVVFNKLENDNDEIEQLINEVNQKILWNKLNNNKNASLLFPKYQKMK